MKNKTKAFPTILFLLVALFTAGCSAESQVVNERKSEQVFPVTQIIAKDTVLHHQYVADIQAVQNVELRARVQGFLEQVYVDEGQEVTKGQLLFKLNDEEYKEELAKARANLQGALAEAKGIKLEIDRLRMLVEKNVISKTEIDVAKAKLDAANSRIVAARSTISNASIKLSYTSIRAPFDGIIDRIPHRTGSLIDHGSLLTTASNISAIYVYFNVSENEYLQYIKIQAEDPQKKNNKVRLILADGSPYPYEGNIETVESEFKSGTGSIAFRARFPNPDKTLKHGASGNIVLSNAVEDAILVPQKAVFSIQDKNYVFLVDSTNQVSMKSFVPQTRFSSFYIVESGLKPGDRIVLEGIQSIESGMQITPRLVGMDSLIAATL
ncbi:efflux RND transporter periplasmic adaptor subunit [Pontibacter diazotrophicus]|uniref:Efflux RND transporter periplasmic adaptor subunit n=1 Tax=Pontibacter diazotrophicus TaxID=1400979 RepID=A0A3D8LAT7_9BACT|nr:efflux RND transporter periplasmic adaptor subunit [Pontibacter diazotrophicus]RDV14515.1 efflux RND transporter periplasmic adaptor subunit [Pontibacter diazotrophicus]